MLPHQERVIAERDELAERLTKLSVFEHSAAFYALTKVEQNLLVAQAAAMLTYVSILNMRIDTFKE